jgi:rubredoxin
MDKIVVFETYYNPIEANIIKSRLIDSGVQCFLSDENMITINPLYTQALGGIKLHLFEKDVNIARSILQDEDVQIALGEATVNVPESQNDDIQSDQVCPNCGSSNVGYVQATKKRFSILTMIVSILLLVYPFAAKKTNHCFDCGYEFE